MPTTRTTNDAPSREPVSMAKDSDRLMAPPSSRVSDDAATGEPDSTRQAPSQPDAEGAPPVVGEHRALERRDERPWLLPSSARGRSRTGPGRRAPRSTRCHHGRPAPPMWTSGTGASWYGPGPVPVIRDRGGASASPGSVTRQMMAKPTGSVGIRPTVTRSGLRPVRSASEPVTRIGSIQKRACLDYRYREVLQRGEGLRLHLP